MGKVIDCVMNAMGIMAMCFTLWLLSNALATTVLDYAIK